MNINTIISRLRALRIDRLRSDMIDDVEAIQMRIDRLRADMIEDVEAIKRLEARQFAGMHVRWARKGKMATRLRQPVPHFLRRGAK